MKKILLLCVLTTIFTGLYCWDVTLFNDTDGLLKVSYDNLVNGQWKTEVKSSSLKEFTIPISNENKSCDIKFTYPDGTGGQVTALRFGTKRTGLADAITFEIHNAFRIEKIGNSYNWR